MALGVAAKAGGKGVKAVGRYIRANPGGAFNALQGGLSINNRVKQGESFMGAAAKEGLQMVMWKTNPGIMAGIQGAQMAYSGTKAAYQFRRRKHDSIVQGLESAAGNTVGGGYMDTNAAATMRQAAVQQIQGNKMNARSALGGEARIFAGNAGYG